MAMPGGCSSAGRNSTASSWDAASASWGPEPVGPRLARSGPRRYPRQLPPSMPRSYPESHIAHGRLVGFSVKMRANEPTYYVYFRGPDGQRLERDTIQVRKEKAREAARAIIEQLYAPAE